MATGGSDLIIDPRITEDDIRFMKHMLRATGKFHIAPKYQMEEEEEEDLEEEDYSLSGQQGQIGATSTPVGGFQNIVPTSFSTKPPSYRVVTPPTPKHNSVRFADQDPSSLEPPQRPITSSVCGTI